MEELQPIGDWSEIFCAIRSNFCRSLPFSRAREFDTRCSLKNSIDRGKGEGVASEYETASGISGIFITIRRIYELSTPIFIREFNFSFGVVLS